MNFLTTKSVLDTTQTLIVDQTATLRARMLAWLNLAMQSVLNEPRFWEFLRKSATCPIVNNVITLPADYGDFINLTITNYLFSPSDMMIAEDVFLADGDEPLGFTIDERLGTLTIVPKTVRTTSTLDYKAAFPAAGYSDGTAATIFPQEFMPLFVRFLQTARNEFDEEDQLPVSMQLNGAELYKMKLLDNVRKAQRKVNVHGYTRVGK